jgi:hypothetical protein
MKTKLMIVPLIALVLSALAFGTAAAEEPQPPTQPYTGYGSQAGNSMHGAMMGGGQTALLHDYITAALADELGLTETQVEAALASGSTLYEIALQNGVLEADLPSFLSMIHASAFEQAVADGVVTRAQADRLNQRMAAYGYGYSDGDCIPDGTAPADGTGMQHGRGMRGGGRGQQTIP